MFESILQRIAHRLPSWLPLSRRGPTWRVSTWWPGDSRDSMQRSLLRLLSIAHIERLDVAPLISNLAEEHRGSQRRRLRRLARRLSDGTPLVDALEQTPDVLRDENVLAIRFASQTGTLASTYPYLIDRFDDASSRVYSRLCQSVAYFGLTLLMMVLILSFLMVFVVPTLEMVHAEFGLAALAPWPFRLWVAACHHVVNYWPLWILFTVGMAWLLGSSSSRRFFRRVVAARWVRDVAQARSAELLRLLSMAVEAGRPLPSALSTLARYHFDGSFRQKLLFARNEVEQGADVWTSLVEARLLTPQESEALAQSSSSKSRVWTMRRLADWKLEQLGRRSEMLAACVEPAITVVFAAIVLLIGSAMFGFLAQMIHSLA
jgi:type II secretory pathway component PulF